MFSSAIVIWLHFRCPFYIIMENIIMENSVRWNKVKE